MHAHWSPDFSPRQCRELIMMSSSRKCPVNPPNKLLLSGWVTQSPLIAAACNWHYIAIEQWTSAVCTRFNAYCRYYWPWEYHWMCWAADWHTCYQYHGVFSCIKFNTQCVCGQCCYSCIWTRVWINALFGYWYVVKRETSINFLMIWKSNSLIRLLMRISFIQPHIWMGAISVLKCSGVKLIHGYTTVVQ